MAQLVKNSPAMREICVGSLGWEDPLEKRQLPTSVFWPREFHGLYRPWGHKESERLSLLRAKPFVGRPDSFLQTAPDLSPQIFGQIAPFQ